MKNILFILIVAPIMALASGGAPLDKAPVNLTDQASLQRGARAFVNYCLNCHGAAYMRYSRLTDLGLSEAQIKDDLIVTGVKVGETMKVAMRQEDARGWFGAAPPDLTMVGRSRGADWLYSYLRGFYRDDSRATGWNNIVFDKVAMPHVLYRLQGEQILEHAGGDGNSHAAKKLVLDKPGTLSPKEFDQLAGDLTNFLVYLGEPGSVARKQLGTMVLIFLAVLLVLAYFLKKEFWKDVH